MPFRFPDYSYRSLISYSVCARIEAEHFLNGELDTYPDSPKESAKEAKSSEASDAVWVQAIVNRQNEPRALHVHLNTKRESSFTTVPIGNASLESVLGSFDKLFGKPIWLKCRARFEILLAEIPSHNVVSLLTSVSLGPNEDQVQLTGATFSISDGPVDQIEWFLEEHDRETIVVARSSANVDATFDPECFQTQLIPLESAFRSFILESGITYNPEEK